MTAHALRCAAAFVLAASSLPARAGTSHFEGGVALDLPSSGTGLELWPGATQGTRPDLAAVRSLPPIFGLARGAWRHVGLFRPNLGVSLELNTDTVSASLDAWNVGAPGISIGLFGRAEALFASAVNSPVYDGVTRRDRGYFASYALGGGRIAYTVLAHLTVEAELAARGWLFNRSFDSAKNLRINKPFFVAEPRVRIKWEGQSGDEGRLGLRRGLAGRIEAGLDMRSHYGGAGESDDRRNHLPSDALPRRIRVEGEGGVQLKRIFWFMARTQAGWGIDEDDLTRARIGGMNPYTVTMPGAAWGEFVSERFAAVHVEAGLRPMKWIYTGLAGHVAVVNDPHRTGELDEMGLLRGVSAETRVGLLGFGRVIARVGGNIDVKRKSGRGALGAFLAIEGWWPR